MTDKEKIRAEVERLKLCTMDEHMKFYSEAAEGEYNAFEKVLEIIDSLSEEPVSEDLAKYAKIAFPVPKREYYTTNECYKEDCLRIIDLRSGFRVVPTGRRSRSLLGVKRRKE